MLASKPIRLGLFALAAAVALALLFYPTEEKRVREAAEAILSGANDGDAALRAALDRYATPGVSVTVAELSEPISGRDQIVKAVALARRFGPRSRFRADAVDVTVEGKRARVNAELVAALEQATIAPRHAVAMFEEIDGRFQLVSAEVGATRRDEPEARP